MLRLLLFFFAGIGAAKASSICIWLLRVASPIMYPAEFAVPITPLVLADGRRLAFTRVIGEGTSSRIVRLERMPQYDFPVVAKVARTERGRRGNLREETIYNRLPQPRSRFVCPILEAAVGQSGDKILIKPELHGTSLDKIIELNIPLSKGQKDSLRELLAWVEANTKGALTKGALTHGRPIDTNPMNIVWVNDPNDLVALGLNPQVPSFVFYELGVTGPLDPIIHNQLFYRRLVGNSP